MSELSERYVIRGGVEGRERLRILARVMSPGTTALLDAVGVRGGMACLDLGCGGGDVTFELARRVGAGGRVLGIDLDPTQVAIAQDEARALGLSQCAFRTGDAARDRGKSDFHLLYVRFLLSHLPDPAAALASMLTHARPGATIVLEDIDFRGHFCDPENAAFARYVDWYTRVVQSKGADPHIGPRLPGLLREAGWADVRARVVQPAGIEGEVRQIAPLTLANIADAVVASGIAQRSELDTTLRALEAFATSDGAFLSLPRVVQAWGRKPA